MEETIEKLEHILSKKLRVDQQEEVSILLKELIDQIPAMPLQANLQPITTYTEQQASMQCRARIAAILLGSFASACHVCGYVTLAARTFAPHQIEPIATPEIARRVVWSHDRQHISSLDLISYVFMLSLCAAAGGSIILGKKQENTDEDDIFAPSDKNNKQFYDYQVGSVLDPINVFTESQNNIFNNINSTILALMTEIGARKSSGVYKTFNKMLLTTQATVQVNSLELNSTEELNYHQCCQNIVEVAFSCFGEAYTLLLQADGQQTIQIRQIWLQQIDQPEQKQRLDIVLYCTLCACLCVQRVQTYIDQMVRLADEQTKQQQKIQQQNKQQAQLIKDLRSQEQQQSNKSKFVNFTKTDMGVTQKGPGKNFKKFSELSADQQDLVKFKATDNLYDYILLKKKLHILLNDQLFGNNQTIDNNGIENANPDDEEIIYQQQLKQQQLDRLLIKLSENKQNLEQIRQLSNSFCMQQKTTDFASLKTGIVNRNATYRPVNPNVPVVKSNDTKIPNMMALTLKEYCAQISRVFYDEVMAGASWTDVKKASISLIYARAVYGGQVFNIECFDDIVQYQEPDLGDENLFLDGLNGQDEENGTEKDDQKKMQRSFKAEAHTVDSQAQTRFQEQKRKQLQQQVDDIKQKMQNIRYTNSRMRLVLDNSVIGKTQALLCRFISYAGKLCSIEDRPGVTTITDQDEKTRDMKVAIDFRNFCTLIANKMASGGNQIGFVPKVDGAAGIRALIADKTLLKTFTGDEIASVLISQWALPVALDSYAVIGLLRKRALGCNPILRNVLNEMLTDLYVYLDVGGTDLMEARQVFNIELT